MNLSRINKLVVKYIAVVSQILLRKIHFYYAKTTFDFNFFPNKSLLKAGGDTTEGQGGVPAFVGFNAGKMSFFF